MAALRPTLRCLAESIATAPMTLNEAGAQLLPPISLYRRLLRVHRLLPEDMRYMGDSYVKSEFRRTRSTDNPAYVIQFLSEWKIYLDELEAQQKGGEVKGKRLSPQMIEKLSDEQVGQLYELMHATKDIWKTPDELASQAVEEFSTPISPKDSDPDVQRSTLGSTASTTQAKSTGQDAARKEHEKLHSGFGDADGVNPSVKLSKDKSKKG